MPRDLPDYGALSAQATVYEVTDLGELAARLGSIVTHDRRGDVIFLDSFEDGLGKWLSSLTGSGAAVELSLARSRNGLYSAHMVGGSTAGGVVYIFHRLPYPTRSALGLELSFYVPGSISSLELSLEVFDGTNNNQLAARWDDVNNELQYRNSGASYTTFATGVDLSTDEYAFHTFKLVTADNFREYARVILDDATYSLADIDGRVDPDGTLPMLSVAVELTPRSGQNDDVYVDDAIITQNEPA